MKVEQYSVLMTVYSKVDPSSFSKSIESILQQTYKTNDFVIVCDGPVTEEIDAVIEEAIKADAVRINVLRLEKNVGTAIATQAGLDVCINDLIMKMDADDVCVNYRAQKQVMAFNEDADLELCGSYMAEFLGDPDNIVQIRKVPLTHEDIFVFSKRRNPFNNITVMYRKSAVQRVGGYGTLRRAQDYELYARMLYGGCKSINLPDILSSARLDNDNLNRRATKNNLEGFVKVRWMIHKMGHSSLLDFAIPCIGQLAYMVMPVKLRGYMYRKYLRNDTDLENRVKE